MAKSLVSALALALLPSAFAFRDTSPFFLFSTAELPIPDDIENIAQASSVSARVSQALDACPSTTYFVIRQHGVASADFVDTRSAPRLAHYLAGKDTHVKSSMVIPEVLEARDALDMAHYLQQKCGAEVLKADSANVAAAAAATIVGPRVIDVSFSAPSSPSRTAELGQHDSELENLIVQVADSRDYTVIYTSTPPTEEQSKAALENQHTYEMDDLFAETMHMELKRDTSAHKRAPSHQGGLFEKYQFFTPGIFMGFIAIVPLFLIVFVGLRALSSLEVSYFAFSKEMGPAAQKKQ